MTAVLQARSVAALELCSYGSIMAKNIIGGGAGADGDRHCLCAAAFADALADTRPSSHIRRKYIARKQA